MSAVKISSTKQTVEPFLLPQGVMTSLFICQLVNLMTLVLQLHSLYLVFALLALFAQSYLYRRAYQKTANQVKQIKPLRILPPWLLIIIALSGSVLLAFKGRELGLLLTMIHLLCFAYSLKLFEIKRKTDIYQLVILGVFVVSTSLIFLQSIYFSFVVISLVFCNFIVLLTWFSPNLSWQRHARVLAKISLYSLPIAIILFVVFPKISPFWQMPSVKSAKVGLSDRVKIGDIAQLALSDELAFRVSFQQQAPPPQQRYWRSLVLDKFDGSSWQQFYPPRLNRFGQSVLTRDVDVLNANDVSIKGVAQHYQVIAEPSYQSWLFALDLATTEDAMIGQRDDYGLYYKGIINQTVSYKVASFPEASFGLTLSRATYQINTHTIAGSNPRLLAKGQALKEQFSQPIQLINHVLQEFNQQPYRYTLQPPTLNTQGNSLDEFYFQTKAGFCEHYASSFTYLMRAAGIPARMVVGYLGGEYNENADYFSVYQRDAHAWTEVWLAGKGWQRVDPTAAVAPERVEQGFGSDLMQEHDDLSKGFFTRSFFNSTPWLLKIRQQIEALDYQWTRWVIGYSKNKQTDILRHLKMAFTSLKTLFYIAIILMIILFSNYIINQYQRKKRDPAYWQQYYYNVLSQFEKIGLGKPKAVTAPQFAQIVADREPKFSKSFNQLTQSFCALSYQKNSAVEQSMHEQNMLVAYKKLRWDLLRAKVRLYISSNVNHE